MKYLTLDALERLAHETGREIEVDNAAGLAMLNIGGHTYVADLPPLPGDAA